MYRKINIYKKMNKLKEYILYGIIEMLENKENNRIYNLSNSI